MKSNGLTSNHSHAYLTWKAGWMAVLDHMAGDFTRQEWAKKIGINPNTLTRWATDYGWVLQKKTRR